MRGSEMTFGHIFLSLLSRSVAVCEGSGNAAPGEPCAASPERGAGGGVSQRKGLPCTFRAEAAAVITVAASPLAAPGESTSSADDGSRCGLHRPGKYGRGLQTAGHSHTRAPPSAQPSLAASTPTYDPVALLPKAHSSWAPLIWLRRPSTGFGNWRAMRRTRQVGTPSDEGQSDLSDIEQSFTGACS